MTSAADLPRLLLAARRLLGIRVIFREYLDQARLEEDLRWRVGPACAAVNRNPEDMATCPLSAPGRRSARLP